MEEHDLLTDIDKRLSLVEVDLSRMAGTRKLLMGILAGVVLQAVGFAFGYGQLIERVDELHLGDLERDVGTALVVIADHGTELAEIRSELVRERLVMDDIRKQLAERTKDRFYRSDAIRLEERISRIEDLMLK